MVDDKLAGWLYEVELAPGSDRQQAISGTANAYAGTAKPSDLPDLVLLGHRIASEEAFTLLMAAMVKEDSTFGCRIDDLETHLIAAAILSAVLERNSMAATTAASLVLNAASVGLKSPIADLPALAMETCRRRANSMRRRGQIASSLDVAKLHAEVPAFDQGGAAAAHQDVRLLRTASVAGFEATAKSLNSLV